MKYTKQQWETLAKRFNEKKMLGKLMLFKQHPNIFKLEEDNGWMMLRLHDQEAMENEYDIFFHYFLSVIAHNQRLLNLLSVVLL